MAGPTGSNSIGPEIDLDALSSFSEGLCRPECVLCTASGVVLVPDWTGRGGIARIAPDGRREFREMRPGQDLAEIRPNGIALDHNGGIVVANLGDEGGIWRLTADGGLSPVLSDLEGAPVPPANFVLLDGQDRLWITVSTRRRPRDLGYRPDVDDGFIALVDSRGARIVADGLGYTNEVQLHPTGQWLYVNETFARRTSRLPIREGGTLGPRETVCSYGPGTFPDGLAFDSEAHFWVTSIVSNRVIRVAPDGTQSLVLEDADPEHLAWVEAAFLSGTLGRPHLDKVAGRRLRNVSSLAFGGSDLRTGYLGCLLGDVLETVRLPVAGVPPVHWTWTA